jgi:two-component system response regulator AtoC
VKPKIWIIDDEEGICTSLQFALKNKYQISTFLYPQPALNRINNGESCDVMLLDLRLKGNLDGIEVLKRIKAANPSIMIIMMTAFSSIKTTVEAMRLGAITYLTKPLDLNELELVINKAIEFKKLGEEIEYLSSKLDIEKKTNMIIGESPEMKKVFDLIETVKNVDANVLITGESGTGKELVAKEIHYSGRRKKEHFVVVNCAAIPENLLEAEFFGSKKGSYTGSTQDVKGKMEIADKGTLFLDEIGDMQLNLQGKLLRAIQEKEFTPVGTHETIKTDARIIAATNRDLVSLIKKRKFREDLYYRLNVVTINVPPLRERRKDIPLLSGFFREKYSKEMNKKVTDFDPVAMEILTQYDYPGNVRQLANIIEYACIVNKDGTIYASDFPDYLSRSDESELTEKVYDGINKFLSNSSIKEIEKQAISATLRKNKGVRNKTADDLGISVRSLQNKINEYNLNDL